MNVRKCKARVRILSSHALRYISTKTCTVIDMRRIVVAGELQPPLVEQKYATLGQFS